MAVTEQELVDIFYDILREDEDDSSAYPPSLAKLLLNANQLKICNGLVSNPLTWKDIIKWQLSFVNTDYFYSSVQDTTLTAAIAVWATEVPVDDIDKYPDAWAIYIKWNIVIYTSKTATQFEWCTWVLFAFPASTRVWIAHVLPTDYGSVIWVNYNNRLKMPAKLYDNIFEDLNDIKGSYYELNANQWQNNSHWGQGMFYTVKDDKYLIFFNINEDDKAIHLRYERLPPTMSSTQWPIISNDTYAKTTIPYQAVWEMLFNRWEEWRAADILNFAWWQIKEMYRFYNNASKEKISWKQVKMAKGRLNV